MTYSEVVDYFTGKGWTREQASGIAGNLMQESGLNPNAAGGGLDQGLGSRAHGGSGQQQLAAIEAELVGAERHSGSALRLTKTPEEAARVFSQLFERPGVPMLSKREGYARAAFNEHGGGNRKGASSGSGEGLIGEAGKAIASPFEALFGGLTATAKLASLVGEWLAEPMKPVKLVGGSILLYMGLRSLTRTGAGSSVASEARAQAASIPIPAARVARRIKRPGKG